MAIDIEHEEVLTLTEATKVMPRVNGRRPAVSTIWRWARKGLKGVRLEYVRVGRNIVTTRQALLRFFTALAEADPPLDGPPDPVITRNCKVLSRSLASPAARQQSIDEANRILDAAGI